MAGSEAEHQRQLEKNELKLKLQNYTEVSQLLLLLTLFRAWGG
jgi:hypothetical protein